MTNWIHESVKLGKGVSVGYFSVIEEGVVLGDNVEIGNHVTICTGTVIDAGVTVFDHSMIGRMPRPAKTSTVKVDANLPSLHIGEATVIGAGAVLYRGSTIGKEVLIGDQAFIREKCTIGDHVVVGRGVAIENQVSIGAWTKIQTNAYITAYTTLEERVFIAPAVVTTNDHFMGRTKERFKSVRGPHVKKGARVGGGSILLPGVQVEEEAFIGAGAVVNRDAKASHVYVGVPARPLREVPAREKLDAEQE